MSRKKLKRNIHLQVEFKRFPDNEVPLKAAPIGGISNYIEVKRNKEMIRLE